MKHVLASVSLAALALAAPIAAPGASPFGASIVRAQSAVTLENLAFKGEVGSVRIPSITVEGSTASKAELEALFDPTTLATLGQRVGKLSARRIAIPLIEVTQLSPEATATTVYRDVVMTDMRDGMVASATIGAMTGNAKPRDGAKVFPGFDVGLGATTLKGMDLGLSMRFLFDKAQPGEALKTALAEQNIGKITYSFGDAGTATIESVTMRDFKLRPLKTPLMDLVAMAERMKGQKNKESERMAIGFVSDIFGAMSFGDMQMRGLQGEMKQPGNKPTVRFAMERMAMAGGADVPGRFQMQGLKFGSGPDAVGIGEVAVDGVSLPGLMAALDRLSAAAEPSPADLDPAAFVPKVDLVRFSGVDIDVPDTKDAKQRIKAKLGLFEVKMANHIGPIPASLAIALDKLQMDIPAATKEKGLQEILALGYKSFDLSGRYDQAWNEATKSLAINELSLRSAGMFAASAKAELINVPKEIFTLDKAVAAVAALGVNAKSLQVRLQNDSLFEKLIAKQARDARRKVEDVRAELAAGATLMVPMFLGDHPAAKAIGTALGKFVADPKTLKVTVTAKGPGLGATDFIAVSNPMDLLKRVDIEAAANE